MKILIVCSKQFYSMVPKIKQRLNELGHTVVLPNCIDDPSVEMRCKNIGSKKHAEFKSQMFRQSAEIIKNVDALLVLNMEKSGAAGYIGGATFLEMYEAFIKEKKIYLYNDLSLSVFSDEIIGFSPMVINGDLLKIK